MDNAILVAILSGASALAAAALTYGLNKRRERETEWRRFKLEHYREYVGALSGITQHTITPDKRRRYADAANNLSLVAPPDVLRALFTLQDAITGGTIGQSQDRLLSELYRVIRRDVHPSKPQDASLTFRLFAPPPEEHGQANEELKPTAPQAVGLGRDR